MEYHIIKEGTRADEFKGPVKISRRISSAVVYAKAEGQNIMIDSGAMGYADEILAGLKKRGVDPSDIGTLINTHMHQDHVYNNYLFPNAVIYTPTSVWYPEDGNRVEMFDEIVDPNIPGLKIIPTPGHMEKHISVGFYSQGSNVIVAGDAIRESIILSGTIPPQYSNPGEFLKSMKKVFDGADIIIPGHGDIIMAEKLRELRRHLMAIRV
jgi:N-acyl homoserine lactone hydrolase